MKRLRRKCANHLIHVGLKLLTGIRCSDRHRNHDAPRLLLTQGASGSQHRSACGQAIIDEDCRPTTQWNRRSAFAIEHLAPRKLLLLLCSYNFDQAGR